MAEGLPSSSGEACQRIDVVTRDLTEIAGEPMSAFGEAAPYRWCQQFLPGEAASPPAPEGRPGHPCKC
jgi:hypothetical protein